jgi:hypothetical protein
VLGGIISPVALTTTIARIVGFDVLGWVLVNG